MKRALHGLIAIVLVGCGDDGDALTDAAGPDNGIADAGLDASPLRDAGARDASRDAQPWIDGGTPPEPVWTLPSCAAAHGIVARDVGRGTAVVDVGQLRAFDAAAGRATVVAGRFDYVWKTVSERDTTTEAQPVTRYGNAPIAVLLRDDVPHLLASTYWEDPVTPREDWETSLTTTTVPRTYVPIGGGGLTVAGYPASRIVTTGAGIDIFSAPLTNGAIDCGVCALRIDGDGTTISPLREVAPGHPSESIILLFDEVTRRGMVLEEMWVEGRSKLFVTAFTDTTTGAFREVVDPFYEASADISPVVAAIVGERVVVVYQVPMGFDVPNLPRYVELSLATGEVLSPPAWYRLGEYADPLLVLTQGTATSVDMFRQPYGPYDDSMPEQYTNRPIEVHLNRPLPLDHAPAADVLRLGAGGWVDDLRAERVGADVWVAWHERGPCQAAPGEFPPLECVGGAYWALLRCDE